jgi:hypothetical protein
MAGLPLATALVGYLHWVMVPPLEINTHTQVAWWPLLARPVTVVIRDQRRELVQLVFLLWGLFAFARL